MKKIIFILLAALSLQVIAYSQTSVTLQINHKLGNEDFEFLRETKNNLGYDFNVKRLEYYISGISLEHDGGQFTDVPEYFILVNAGADSEYDLGEFNIQTLEKIHFHVGVDPEFNHTDPALYPSTHPLSPKFPSMHWGWAAGYRFIAIEGKSGKSFTQVFELHGLGDINYFKTSLDVNKNAVDNAVTIPLDADYNEVLRDMELNQGLIVHGEWAQAQQALYNMRDYVFTVAESPNSILQKLGVTEFKISPNPAPNGEIQMSFNSKSDLALELKVYSSSGQILTESSIRNSEILHMDLEHKGMILVQLSHRGEVIASKKVLIP